MFAFQKLGRYFCAVSVVFCSAPSILAQTPVVYQQLPNYGFSGLFCDLKFGQNEADDFVLNNDTLLTRVSWWGLYSPVNTNPTDNFRLRIYDDLNRNPNQSSYTTLQYTNLQRVFDRVDPLGDSVYYYSADSLYLVPANTTKYLEIENNTGDWAIKAGGYGRYWSRTDDKGAWGAAPYDYYDGNLAFVLEGTVVPEPDAGIIAVGLVTMGCCVLRRRKARL